MKRKIFIVLSLVVLSGLAITWTRIQPSVSAVDDSQSEEPFARLNHLAREARTGDQTLASELVGEMIKTAGLDSKLRGFTATAIQSRVGRAESRYRRGQSPGVRESKVVRTVNGLVAQFQLPGFVTTNNYEVRKLRLELMHIFPDIISRSAHGIEPLAQGASLDDAMSPAESLFVLAMMLQQKLANPEYQVSFSERLDQWLQTHNHRAGRYNSPVAQNRTAEFTAAIRRAVGATSYTDALQLSNVTLNTLGIEQ